MRNVSKLDCGPRLSGIMVILESIREPIQSSKLQTRTGIKYKKSYLNYLRFLQEKKLIERTERKYKQSLKGKPFQKFVHNDRILVFYKISENGKKFLELVS